MAGFPQPERAYVTGFRISEKSHPVPNTYVCNRCIEDREKTDRPVMNAIIWLSKGVTVLSIVAASGLWLAHWLEVYAIEENWLYIPILSTMAAGFIWAMFGADDELHRIAPIDEWHAEALEKLELPFTAKLCPGLFDLEDEIPGTRKEDQSLPLAPELAIVRSDQIQRLLKTQAESGYAYFSCHTELHYTGIVPARPTGLVERLPQYENLGELIDQETH